MRGLVGKPTGLGESKPSLLDYGNGDPGQAVLLDLFAASFGNGVPERRPRRIYICCVALQVLANVA
jgi:hypothetical protein